MSDDLVTRLRDARVGNTVDVARQLDDLCQEAATALTEARAEIERQADWIRRLQTALMFWMPGVDIRLDDATRELAADDAKLLAGHSGPLDCSCWGDEILARALAAESELSTLRARVREVVGPFAQGSIDISGAAIIIGYPQAESALRAARQLMEDLKQ